MSIKIEGGEGAAENVIKAGASNELLYNDKEVLLKENFDLGLKLLPPDLSKAQKWELKTNLNITNPFTVPEDGWIVKIEFCSFEINPESILNADYFIKIDGIGGVGITPSQEFLGEFLKDTSNSKYEYRPIGIKNLNCPYPVKKGQVITSDVSYYHGIIIRDGSITMTFAPCMSV